LERAQLELSVIESQLRRVNQLSAISRAREARGELRATRTGRLGPMRSRSRRERSGFFVAFAP